MGATEWLYIVTIPVFMSLWLHFIVYLFVNMSAFCVSYCLYDWAVILPFVYFLCVHKWSCKCTTKKGKQILHNKICLFWGTVSFICFSHQPVFLFKIFQGLTPRLYIFAPWEPPPKPLATICQVCKSDYNLWHTSYIARLISWLRYWYSEQ